MAGIASFRNPGSLSPPLFLLSLPPSPPPPFLSVEEGKNRDVSMEGDDVAVFLGVQGILMFAVKLILDRTPELKKDELVPEVVGRSSEPQTPSSPRTAEVRAIEDGWEGSAVQSPVGSGKAKMLKNKKSFRNQKSYRASASFRQRQGSSSPVVRQLSRTVLHALLVLLLLLPP